MILSFSSYAELVATEQDAPECAAYMKLTPLACMYIVTPPLLNIYMYCTPVAEHSFSVDVGLLHMSKFKTQNCRIFYNDNEPNMNNPDGIYEIERYHYTVTTPYLTNGHICKLLGIHFDKHLSFDIHAMHLCNKEDSSHFCINLAKNFLTPKALLSVGANR
jgi:hypothetical protein